MWQSVRSDRLGLINSFDDAMVARQWRNPSAFPDLRGSESLLVFSDYGGDHQGSPYHGYAYLFVGSSSIPAWDRRRLTVRERFRIRNRSFAYKKLTDRRKLEALPHFLAAASPLQGLCVIVLIDKRVASLIDANGVPPPTLAEELWPEAKYKAATFERLMRVIHFNALFTAGLVGRGQNVIWITDRDEIAANPAQLSALTNALSRCLSAFLANKDEESLRFTLGHCRCGTTAFDVDLQLEDLAAIPDLAVGAVIDTISCYKKDDRRPRRNIVVPPPETVPPKAKTVLNWFSDDQMRLRRLVLLLEPGQETLFQLKALDFHGSSKLRRLNLVTDW